MADMITRCPKCGTAFRISDTLLKSAKGVVRCGSCLSVFNAKDHLETKPSSATAREITPTVRTAPTAASKPEPEPVVAPEQPEDPAEELNPWRTQQREESLFERPRAQVQEDEEDEEDEAWALELLKDDSDLNVRFKKVSDKPISPAPPAQLESPTAPSASTRAAPEPEASTPPTPAPAAATPPALPPEPVVAKEPKTVQVDPPAAVSTAAASAAATSVVATSVVATKRKPIRPKFEPKSVPLDRVMAALEPEPLELDWRPTGSWKKRLLWPLLVLVALICLLVQVAWLEFHRLNRLEPYRSIYGIACQVLGCTLPELRDLSQIQTSNLVVRSNPELEGVLKVDVILQNNAPFEQAFPNIQLTFTNMNNEPVAARVLQPAEYLGGELAGRDKMPERQPIHIGMEIADPGQDAVSYHISIVD
jgi:predicted Zn finger-like uncharacterized protein